MIVHILKILAIVKVIEISFSFDLNIEMDISP